MEEKHLKKSGTTDALSDSFKKATSEMMILFLLQERPMYVYELIQELDRRSQSEYKVAALYLAMNRLQKFGYISEAEKQISDQNRVRKYYRITDSGTMYFEQLKEQYQKMTRAIEQIFSFRETDWGGDVKPKPEIPPGRFFYTG